MLCENIRFISAGSFTTHSSQWLYPKHSSAESELIYVTDGILHICEDYSEYHAEPGSVLLLEGGHTHYGIAPSEDGVSFLRILFDEAPESGDGGDGWQIVLGKLSRPANVKRFDTLFRLLIDCSAEPDYPPEYLCNITRLLISELFLCSAAPDSTLSIAQRIAYYIKNEAPSGIMVRDIADRFGYSEDHITRIFKAFYARGIKEYADAVRISRIKSALVDRCEPAEETARREGFAGTGAMYRFFKAHTGMTCSEFKKLYVK